MKNKTLTYLALSLLCCICACTSVDLCPEAEHPHITDMRVRLNWGDISKDEIPAEMHIVASRIINTWRTRGIIDTSIDPATNNNITQQETSSDTRTASNAKENSEDNSIESPEETASSFYLRGGEYNILSSTSRMRMFRHRQAIRTVPYSHHQHRKSGQLHPRQ